MSKVNTRTRIVAGTPLEVGERRFLPSILMTTVQVDIGEGGHYRAVRLRPISVVEQGPEGNRWHPIPNTTRDTLSVMSATGLSVALFSIFALLLIKLARR
ncbi:MAG: hypothetical protein ACP5HM_00775 [Anaerolineae bacterium]